MSTDDEGLRARFKPKQVRLLLVGESRPVGGTFFYHGDSRLFKRSRDAFETYYGPSADESAFLERFKSLGCFLIDLCDEPVNGMSPRERRERHVAGEGPLAAKFKAQKPKAVVVVIKRIADSVNLAMANAKLAVPKFILPFPSQGHDREYVSGLYEVVAKLAAMKILRER